MNARICQTITGSKPSEADYKVVIKDGKVRLEEYVYETEDLGEL